MDKINIRGVNFDNVTMDEAVEICKGFLRGEGAKIIHTPNAEGMLVSSVVIPSPHPELLQSLM